MAGKPRRSPSKKGEWEERYLGALEEHGQLRAAAHATGVASSTVYAERQRNPEFARRVEEILHRSAERVEDTLYALATSGKDTTATIFFLKTRKPEVYGDRLRAEQVAQIRAEARQQVLSELQSEISLLTPAAKRAVLAALPKANSNGAR